MMGFIPSELLLQANVAEREREAKALARPRALGYRPRGLRAALAAWLSHLAIHLRCATTDRPVKRRFTSAGRRG
jgi:hypothetical protein